MIKQASILIALTLPVVACSGQPAQTSPKLIWQEGFSQVAVWDEAKAYCQNLKQSGSSEWRLPRSGEMMFGTVDLRTHTMVAPSGIYAVDDPVVQWWGVYAKGTALVSEAMSGLGSNSKGYVRCVRALPSA